MRFHRRMPLRLVICSWPVLTFAAPLFHDDFSTARRYERMGQQSWAIRDGVCRFDNAGREACLVANLDDLQEATIETVVKVEKRIGNQYPYAGLILYEDSDNSWKLLLVENPKRTRYLELLERCAGVHQAQSRPEQSGTRLSGKGEGKLRSWQYGRSYRVTISLGPKAVVGRVTELVTGDWWQQTYYFASGKAVRRGRPGLCVAGHRGLFQSFSVDGKRPPAAVGLSAVRGPAGSAAILPDESGASSKQLSAALSRAGFGVTELQWSALSRGGIPPEQVDLVVLADARRLPVSAKSRVLSFLRRGGKLLAIGAPAFGSMLAECPKGWVTEDQYGNGIVESLGASAIPLDSGKWKRAAKNPARAAEHDETPDAWRVSVDLEGWDGFGKKVLTPFPPGFAATVFWAKGDGRTPQLAVEWREKDTSRWIGTVPLSTEWRAYILEPRHFAHWHDSKAKRGGPGDCFNPQNAAEIIFWLSSSHTPKCQPGRHTYWVRGLSWSPAPKGPRPDFRPPEIETLSPSYKIHPISSPTALAAGREQAVLPADWTMPWTAAGYSSLWRERGRGWDRGRAWRWVPVAEALDAAGRRRGALVSLLIGDQVLPDALVASVAVADPLALANAKLMSATTTLTKAMVRGCFLTQAGSRFFSYHDGEQIELGAEALNCGHARRSLRVSLTVTNNDDQIVYAKADTILLEPRTRGQRLWQWSPESLPPEGCTLTAELYEGETLLDRIRHRVDRLPSEPAKPEDFITVRGSHFYHRGKPWFMRGINYRPNFIGGYRTLDVLQRVSYDPEIIERDLSTLESMGINFLSGLHALHPPAPEAPASYRDLHDFLNRCRNHGIKIFYFVPWGRPYRGADVEKIKQHITVAGIKDHPAILAWELAWEPSENPWKGKMNFITGDWNRWVAARYGSAENALQDWGFDAERSSDGALLPPSAEMCRKHGKWDRMVAAFRRCFSDLMSREYGRIVAELRRFDRLHLISFRGGACGIPYAERFAHLHSVGVAKHVDFLTPEGYNLMTHGWGKPTPGDDIRKGGLITLYYRFISREKPVVWMEFGYTIRGFRGAWTPEMVHNSTVELARQKQEYEHFYRMFLESGARGAAPWWLPGGFRLGERSDFGVLDPDGAERPVCEVIRRYVPQFSQVRHKPATAYIDIDLDAHYPDSWPLYREEYLRLVKAGKTPYLRTAGTGADSANAPLVAVGGGPCNGHNPPQYLNAEFNSLEVSDGRGWHPARAGGRLEAKRGSRILCRASIGNIAEATWLTSRPDVTKGAVYLASRQEYGLDFKAPIAHDTQFLKDATVKEFTLVASLDHEVAVSFEMLAEGRTYFGERRTVVIVPSERP